MQLKLLDLFVVVTYSAVVAWAATWQGPAEPLFWFSVVISAIVTSVMLWLVGTRRWTTLATLVFLGAVPSCAAFQTSPLGAIANASLLVVSAVWFAWRGTSSARPIVYAGIATHALVIAATTLPFIDYHRRQVRTLARFPVESLASRLQYEQRPRGDDGEIPIVLRAELAEPLDEYDRHAAAINYRGMRLAKLHAGEVESFVQRSGFGVSRARPTRWIEFLDLPPLEDVPCDPAEFEAPLRDEWTVYWTEYGRGRVTDATELHRVNLLDFLHPKSMGAVMAGRRRVAGFVSHAFHKPPPPLSWPRETWVIRRLELVSLLRFDDPRVYVLDHLPRMDQLSSETVETRALDEFESAALGQLHRDEDVVLDDQPAEIRMLGALRASNECRNCHEVERGALLGAFTYRIERVAPRR